MWWHSQPPIYDRTFGLVAPVAGFYANRNGPLSLHLASSDFSRVTLRASITFDQVVAGAVHVFAHRAYFGGAYRMDGGWT